MMTNPVALIIDDEPDIRELLEMTLARMDIDAESANDLMTAKNLLSSHSFDLCLTDMRLPDGDGLDLVEYIQTHFPTLPTAVITAHGNMESAITALKHGAFDFVSKPVDLHILRNLVTTALKLKPQISQLDDPLMLLGKSETIQNTRATITKLARSQAPVYIAGESGSGKELVARLIHEQGPRSDSPFIPVNCGAIPDDLMESEFFGHKKGSFTGAIQNKQGLFQAADGGTLFLDEVADLPLHMQVKLLRAIQEKAIRPIGEQREIPVDVRILSATHKNLAELVDSGKFRQDLYYRINVIEVHVPSLRQRIDDIPVLAEHFLQRLSSQSGQAVPLIAEDAVIALQGYAFPGNVRELENILERAMTLCENNVIRAADLQLKNIPEQQENMTTTPAAEEASHPDALDPYLDNAEKKAIMNALEATRYNKTAAARLLGITFRALRYRLKKYGIQ